MQWQEEEGTLLVEIYRTLIMCVKTQSQIDVIYYVQNMCMHMYENTCRAHLGVAAVVRFLDGRRARAHTHVKSAQE